MVKYRLSEAAENDLANIWNYTVEEWSITQAEEYVDGIFACFDALADRRRNGKPANDIREGYLKLSYVKHYIYYRLSQDRIIEIIRILHVSMDAARQDFY